MEDRSVLPQLGLGKEETQVDARLGYPTGYAKLCKYAPVQMKGLITPFTEGPPKRFLPYAPSAEEIARLREFEKMFPIIPEGARDSRNARRHAESLWLQLDHLGNAGFDPGLFRVDKYGNVLYWHADPASPLAWEVDHWFPHSRGGKTVARNLRIVQWQVNQKKKERLEFVIPWWDLQLGISVNQFLSPFKSKNIEFRNRCLSLFFQGEAEMQANEQLIVSGHSWPQHFRERKTQNGLAAAALVTVNEPEDGLKDINSCKLTHLQSVGSELSAHQIAATPARRRWSLEEEEALRRAIQKIGPGNWKEIKESEPALVKRSTVQIKDKYRLMRTDLHFGKENIGNVNGNAIALQKAMQLNLLREEEKREKDAEIARLEEHMRRARLENEKQTEILKGLEEILKEHRQQVEKERQWAETQASYRLCLERMIRDTIHQSAVYKEQAKLNQAACNALAAQLKTQITSCEAAEAELVKIFQQRESLEAMAYPQSKSIGLRGVDLVDLSSCLSESLRPQADTEAPNNCITVLRIKDEPNMSHASPNSNKVELGSPWKGSRESYDDVQNTAHQMMGCSYGNIRSIENGHDARIKEEVGIDMQASQHRKLWRQISGHDNHSQQNTEQEIEFQLREFETEFGATDGLDPPVSQASILSKEASFQEENPLTKTKEELESEQHNLNEEEPNIDIPNKQEAIQSTHDSSNPFDDEAEPNSDIPDNEQALQTNIDSIIPQHDQIELNQSGNNKPIEEENNQNSKESMAAMEVTEQSDGDQRGQETTYVVNSNTNAEIEKANGLSETENPRLEEAFLNVLALEESVQNTEGQQFESEEATKRIGKSNVDKWLDMLLSDKVATHFQNDKGVDYSLSVDYNKDERKDGGQEAKSESEKSKGIFEVLLRRLTVKQQTEVKHSMTEKFLGEKEHQHHQLTIDQIQDDGNDHKNPEELNQTDSAVSEELKDAAEDSTTGQVSDETTYSFHSSASQSLATEEASQSSYMGLSHHFRSMSASISHSRLDEEDTTLTRSGSKTWYLGDLHPREQAKPGIKASIRAYTQAWIRTVKKLEARIQE
ncbi:hypothetical protein O6H91_21G010600 [Diphasiastrum complanatum]|uniref:Uncharacterized protein n=4 Tax=Diphasiastrum complanatum TaxID=34168 RepID=A0ACC2AHQ4_DIPCM|nr:hypothetical protein O6H91_21G010600 [Diphasiastrum complanatum]KAJ7517097.1 hypothetical protein O6H91_21G010600 [Diphasiastrum complanatum]KAJ7517098.1 hypothetical protein O6H91_21G010600 [Diphasiastrum complanatum]KAJ7517099.1 hypothetical protein O6H91_21G010600 [Diphasiastrum complanatum]